MKVLSVTDQPDGSAIVEMDMDEDEVKLFMEVGFNKILRDSMEEMKKNAPIGKGTAISEQKKGSDT